MSKHELRSMTKGEAYELDTLQAAMDKERQLRTRSRMMKLKLWFGALPVMLRNMLRARR